MLGDIHTMMSSNSPLPALAPACVCQTKARSMLRFCASSAPTPPVGAFLPNEKITAGAAAVSVAPAAQLLPAIPVAVEHTVSVGAAPPPTIVLQQVLNPPAVV